MTTDRGVAWVVGGSSGIGAAVARRLADEGWTLALTDEPGMRPPHDLAVAWHGSCDVRDSASVGEAYQHIRDEVGEVHVVSYNVGVNGPYEAQTTTLDDWQRTLAVNLMGAVLVAEAVAPDMVERGDGAIVLTASTNAHKPASYMIPYRVSKAGLVMYMRCLALRLAPHGVRVNAVCPGVILTPMQMQVNRERAALDGRSAEEALALRQQRIPSKRFVMADEVAAVVAFLAKGQAPSILGQEIVVDGGDVQFL